MILLISPEDKYATRRIIEEAEKKRIKLKVFDVEALAAKKFKVDIEEFDVLWIRQSNPYYKELITLAQKFKDKLKIVIDEYSILDGFDTGKMGMYEKLRQNDIPAPKTEWLSASPLSSRTFPFVLKWNYGFGGKQVHLIHDAKQLDELLSLHPLEEWLVQEYLPSIYEWEVYVKGFKCLAKVLRFGMLSVKGSSAAMVKKDRGSSILGKVTTSNTEAYVPQGDFLPFKVDINNYQSYGARNFPSLSKLAEQAAQATNRELCKVDILQAEENFYVLEVNRAPSFLPFEQFAGVNAAGEFINYIANRIRDGV
jgi:glutathione synthase/RimK-type ligase-like ATP-grasp enzyme